MFFSISGAVYPPNEQGMYTYSYDWEITGGTGRFVGGTGGGTAEGASEREGTEFILTLPPLSMPNPS
ncbi:MAG: hypothetical protein IPN76_20740 [Saprospiraceae bacterium]|nr:hypothetical protein [Saprospiraceae bacterium]